MTAAADDDRFWDKYVDKQVIAQRTASSSHNPKDATSVSTVTSGGAAQTGKGAGRKRGRSWNDNAGPKETSSTKARGSTQTCYGYQDGSCEGNVCPNLCPRTGKPRLHVCLKCKRAPSLPRGLDKCKRK